MSRMKTAYLRGGTIADRKALHGAISANKSLEQVYEMLPQEAGRL